MVTKREGWGKGIDKEFGMDMNKRKLFLKKLDSIKIKIIYSAKDTIKEEETQAVVWEKIFTNHTGEYMKY